MLEKMKEIIAEQLSVDADSGISGNPDKMVRVGSPSVCVSIQVTAFLPLISCKQNSFFFPIGSSVLKILSVLFQFSEISLLKSYHDENFQKTSFLIQSFLCFGYYDA